MKVFAVHSLRWGRHMSKIIGEMGVPIKKEALARLQICHFCFNYKQFSKLSYADSVSKITSLVYL